MKKSKVIEHWMIPIARPIFGDEELTAIKEVLDSGIVVQGPKVAEFEKRFAAYLGVKNAVAVNSGTSALHLALLAYGVKTGREVVIPPLSFIATASTILMCGARPIFSDIDEETYTLDSKMVKKVLSPKTSILMPVHLYGQTADMKPLLEIAEKKDIAVIEDAAQAHGAAYNGKKAGSLGDAACFSFYATKTMTTGEGGMITTNDDEVADKCKLLRDHGQTSKYKHDLFGYNYRMTEMAAAIGLVQLRKLDTFVLQRRRNAAVLTTGLRNTDTVAPPVEASGRFHTYYQYILKLRKGFPQKREELMKTLEEKGISSRPSYPEPLYRQKALAGKVKSQKCKIAESVLPNLLELPVHPLVPRWALETTTEAIRKVAQT